MATALASSALPFLLAPTKPHALESGHRHTIHCFRKFAQGGATAVLAYLGAGNLMEPSAAEPMAGAPAADAPITDFTTVEGITQGMMSGSFTGPAMLVAGAMLFLMAGRSKARLFGLVAGILLTYFYAQGMTFDDVWRFVQGFGIRLGAAAHAFQTADVTA